MQSFLEFSKTEEHRIQECIDFLEERGYRVISPVTLNRTSVKNAPQLVDYFYALLMYHNPDRKIHYNKASKKDIGLASKFITQRQAGSGRARAVQECAAIIKCVVENEDLFCFSEPLHSMDCFGQDNMKWVTDRALSILNEENEYVEEQELKLYMEDLDNKHEKEALEDIDDRISSLKNILGGLKNAKEESDR